MTYSQQFICPICGHLTTGQIRVFGDYDPSDGPITRHQDTCNFCKGLEAGAKELFQQLKNLARMNDGRIEYLKQLREADRQKAHAYDKRHQFIHEPFGLDPIYKAARREQKELEKIAGEPIGKSKWVFSKVLKKAIYLYLEKTKIKATKPNPDYQ